MSQFNIAEAKARFSQLVKEAMLGGEIIIAKDNKPVLKLVPLDRPKQPRTPGSGKGQILYIAPDFDATPEGFEEYV
ncbi:MAG: type II toxin-antitoxin system prevent-host-death family antitoxin [Longimicrobiales bacterium]|nr:type II toxin-antitoxin system prevent-host-death family antitoxin [Longimicrobiales bacterium]